MEAKDLELRPPVLQELLDNPFAFLDPKLVNIWNNARMSKDEWSAPCRRCHEFSSSNLTECTERIQWSLGGPSAGMSMTVHLVTRFYPAGVRVVFVRPLPNNDETKDDPPPRIDLHTPVDYSDLPELEDGDALALD